MRGLPSILSFFFATSLINSIIQSTNVRFYLSYEIQITLKSHFCRKNVIILSLGTQRFYRRHNVSRKYINHWWFIDFIAWRFILSLPDPTSCDKGIFVLSGNTGVRVLFLNLYIAQKFKLYVIRETLVKVRNEEEKQGYILFLL